MSTVECALHRTSRMLRRETVLPQPRRFRVGVATLVCTIPFFLVGVRLGALVERHASERRVLVLAPAGAPRCEVLEVRTTVVRAAVDEWLARPDDLTHWARVVPSLHRPRDGVRLYAIRPGSPLAILGVHNGDRLLRVNGRDLAAPDQALALYAALRSTDHLTIDLTRAGCPVRITVAIV